MEVCEAIIMYFRAQGKKGPLKNTRSRASFPLLRPPVIENEDTNLCLTHRNTAISASLFHSRVSKVTTEEGIVWEKRKRSRKKKESYLYNSEVCGLTLSVG